MLAVAAGKRLEIGKRSTPAVDGLLHRAKKKVARFRHRPEVTSSLVLPAKNEISAIRCPLPTTCKGRVSPVFQKFALAASIGLNLPERCRPVAPKNRKSNVFSIRRDAWRSN